MLPLIDIFLGGCYSWRNYLTLNSIDTLIQICNSHLQFAEHEDIGWTLKQKNYDREKRHVQVPRKRFMQWTKSLRNIRLHPLLARVLRIVTRSCRAKIIMNEQTIHYGMSKKSVRKKDVVHLNLNRNKNVSVIVIVDREFSHRKSKLCIYLLRRY